MDLTLQIRGETVSYFVYESETQVAHVYTKEELRQLEKYEVTIQNNKKIVYLHKRNFEISNSRHADERNTNWSYAMLSRDTKNAS